MYKQTKVNLKKPWFGFMSKLNHVMLSFRICASKHNLSVCRIYEQIKCLKVPASGNCMRCSRENCNNFSFFIPQINNKPTGETIAAYVYTPEAIYGMSHLHILPSHRLLHGNNSLKEVLQKEFIPGKGDF